MSAIFSLLLGFFLLHIKTNAQVTIDFTPDEFSAPSTTEVDIGNVTFSNLVTPNSIDITISCNLGTLTFPAHSVTLDPGSTSSLITATGQTQTNLETMLTGIKYTASELYTGKSTDPAIANAMDYVTFTILDNGTTYVSRAIKVAVGTQQHPSSGCTVNQCNSRGYCDQTTYTCTCYDPYYGTNCENKKCEEDCVFVPNAACKTDGTCDCQYIDGTLVDTNTLFYGDYCQFKKCSPELCNSNGVCDVDVGICECYSGYFGDVCQWKECDSDCSEQGRCDFTTGTCACQDGWSGDGCEFRTCSQSCGIAGYCDVKTGTCTCHDGYLGNDCKFKSCPNDCTNTTQGKCDETTGVCTCLGDFYGADCSRTYTP
mmetsp:Transcript_64875/g.74571  ORF Transcript_64875/g.74571 Transcript_64875/m.74571 type:complete len:370 (-) Transcript_64875:808-1917(-)